jgi:SAM-dependent methyltransferase
MSRADRVVVEVLKRTPRGDDLRRAYFRRRYVRPQLVSSMRHPELFADRLPDGYGIGLTERAVEFGWTAAQQPAGDVLDAGSTLNHGFTLDHFLPQFKSLTIVTLAPEKRSYPERGVSYFYQDLRALDFKDDSFDTVVSLSTLEHVGLDNEEIYGAKADTGDPNEGARKAMRELVRVARPGARLLISVPFGAAWRGSWVRQFDADGLDELIAAAGPARVREAIYRRSDSGWQRVAREAAADAKWQGFFAEAVACVRLDLDTKNG